MPSKKCMCSGSNVEFGSCKGIDFLELGVTDVFATVA